MQTDIPAGNNPAGIVLFGVFCKIQGTSVGTAQPHTVIQEKSMICVSRIIEPSGHPDGFVSIKTEGRIDYGKKRRPGD